MVETIDEHKFLWDKSEPGWCLKALPVELKLSVVFGSEGPTNREILSLRKLNLNIFNSPLSKLHAEMKGKNSIELGVFDDATTENLVALAKSLSLKVVLEKRERYIIFNKITKVGLLIEDSDMCKSAKERMLAEGVDVIAP